MKNKLILEARKLTRLGDKFLLKHGNKKFHEEACQLLEQADLANLFDYKELVEAAFSKDFDHRQNFKSLEFSDLPLTIARGSECFIDVYFWRRRPTVIHNHHFSGAFQCLLGMNVDSEYKFKTTKKLTKHHALGELELIRTRNLNKGDVESINLLDKFIHQNHHHADLTVNLCFRTPEVPKKNLSNYLLSGLRYEKDPVALARAQRLYAFTRIDDFEPKKLNITTTDALFFLIQSHGSNAKHPRLLKLQKFLEAKIKAELGFSVSELLELHEQGLDQIQSSYE